MVSRFRSFARLLAAAIVVVCVLVSAGCQVQFVSSYDQVTDQSLTALQEKTEGFFQRLERGLPPAAGNYADNKEFYSSVNTSLETLIARNKGRPKNKITNDQLEELKKQFKELEETHKRAPLAADVIAPPRDSLNQSFEAILKLELAKKRGEEK